MDFGAPVNWIQTAINLNKIDLINQSKSHRCENSQKIIAWINELANNCYNVIKWFIN